MMRLAGFASAISQHSEASLTRGRLARRKGFVLTGEGPDLISAPLSPSARVSEALGTFGCRALPA